MKKKSDQGFSLIELLLVMAIMGLVLSTSYVGFIQFSRQQALNVGVNTLKNDLNVIKSNATSQVRVTTQCNQADRRLIGHQIIFTSSNSYDLQEVCSSGGSEVIGQIKSSSLPSMIEFQGGPPTRLRFLVLNQGIEGLAPRTIDLIHNETGKKKPVTIDKIGVIK